MHVSRELPFANLALLGSTPKVPIQDTRLVLLTSSGVTQMLLVQGSQSKNHHSWERPLAPNSLNKYQAKGLEVADLTTQQSACLPAPNPAARHSGSPGLQRQTRMLRATPSCRALDRFTTHLWELSRAHSLGGIPKARGHGSYAHPSHKVSLRGQQNRL